MRCVPHASACGTGSSQPSALGRNVCMREGIERTQRWQGQTLRDNGPAVSYDIGDQQGGTSAPGDLEHLPNLVLVDDCHAVVNSAPTFYTTFLHRLFTANCLEALIGAPASARSGRLPGTSRPATCTPVYSCWLYRMICRHMTVGVPALTYIRHYRKWRATAAWLLSCGAHVDFARKSESQSPATGHREVSAGGLCERRFSAMRARAPMPRGEPARYAMAVGGVRLRSPARRRTLSALRPRSL